LVVWLQTDQFCRVYPYAVGVVGGHPAVVDLDITPPYPTQLLKSLKKRIDPPLPFWIALNERHQHPNPPHAVC
jgi:hypothetical protein